MLMTMSGVAVEQMEVKPTMSLNNMVTSSCFWAWITSPVSERVMIQGGNFGIGKGGEID